MKSTFIFYYIIFVFGNKKRQKRDFFFYDFNFGLIVVFYEQR